MATRTGVILSVVGGLVITSAVALGGWNLTKTAQIPETYPTKIEVNDDNSKQDKRIDKQDTRIEQLGRDIQEGFQATQRLILDLHKK